MIAQDPLRLTAVASAPFRVRLALTAPGGTGRLPMHGRSFGLALFLPDAGSASISLASHEWDAEGIVILAPGGPYDVEIVIAQASLAAVPDTTGAAELTGDLMSTDQAGRSLRLRPIILTLKRDA